jgi:phage gpG-like protein
MRLPFSTKLIDANAAIGGLDGMIARADDLSRPLDRLGAHLVRKTNRVLRSGERGIQARHGAGLAASITYRTFFGAGMVIGSNKAYAAIHQFGGIAESSRSGGFLAIPIADNLRSNGDAKYLSPRLVEGGFFFRSQRTGALLFGRVLSKRVARRRAGYRGKALSSLRRYGAESGTVELLFALVRQVVIPERRYATFDPADRQLWDEYAADWILRGR